MAKSSLQKIKEQNKDNQLEQILRDERHFLIRKFLNDLIESQPDQYGKQQQQQQENENDFKQAIENCCRENLISLLRHLLEENKENLSATKNEFLIIAAEYGNKDIVECLIENGIDVNQQNKNGSTALMWASRNGLKEIVQLLLKNECIKVNQQNNDGRTALMLASFAGHKEIIDILLKHKDIQTTQQDEKGFSALRWAIEKDHKEIAKILDGKVKRKNQQQQQQRSPAMLSSC